MSGIPRLIHFAALGGHTPEWAEWNIQRFRELNPKWKVLVHGEDALRPQLRHGYAAISGEHEWGRKSDLIRLSVLTLFGGWWFDWDFLPFRPLADIEADHDLAEGLFLTQGTPKLIANGVIGTIVRSAGLLALWKEAARLSAQHKSLAWDAYGPGMYTPIVHRNPRVAVIGSSEMFYPLQRREDSVAAYRRLRADGCSEAAQEREFGAGLRPYMMHMSMMDALELPEPEVACA